MQMGPRCDSRFSPLPPRSVSVQSGGDLWIICLGKHSDAVVRRNSERWQSARSPVNGHLHRRAAGYASEYVLTEPLKLDQSSGSGKHYWRKLGQVSRSPCSIMATALRQCMEADTRRCTSLCREVSIRRTPYEVAQARSCGASTLISIFCNISWLRAGQVSCHSH